MKLNAYPLLKIVAALLLAQSALAIPYAEVNNSDWEINGSRDNFSVFRVHFKNRANFATQALWNSYISSFMAKHFFLANSDGQFVSSPTVTKVLSNTFLNQEKHTLLLEITHIKNNNGQNLRLFIQDPTTVDPTPSATTSSLFFNEISIGGFWFTKAEWEKVFYEIFSWVKRVLIVTQFYLIFVRPALNNVHEVSVAWFGVSIMMIQTMFWIPYLSGSFGGVIDSILMGIAKARQDWFGNRTSAYYISTYFVRAAEEIYQNKLFPRIDKFTAAEALVTTTGMKSREQIWLPNPLMDSQYELILFTFGIIFPIFTGAMKNKSLNKMAKSLKNGVVISFALPLFNNSLMNIIHLFWAGHYSSFHIFSAIISLIIILVLALEFVKLYSPSTYSSTYFNYETGLIDFDCHYRVPIAGWVKRIEVWLLMGIPTITWLIGNLKLASPVAIGVIYLVIAIVNLMKANAHKNFRKDIVTLNQLKFIDNLIRVFLILIMSLFWIPLIGMVGIDVMTVFFVVFLFLNIGLYAVIWIARIAFEVQKAYEPETLEDRFPEIPNELLDMNRALASIGKGRAAQKTHAPVSTTQIHPAESTVKVNNPQILNQGQTIPNNQNPQMQPATIAQPQQIQPATVV